MSEGRRISLEEARRHANVLQSRLPPRAFFRWAVAGSVRRQKPEVGDIEHVVIPQYQDATPVGSMFPEKTNMLWRFLDSQIDIKTIRGGERYRAIEVDGVKHDIFLADEDNWGAILAIRTGPADFSQRCVIEMRKRGRFIQDKGYVRYAKGGAILPCPTEERWLELCGLEWIEPEDRS